jgi:hypothetical protein
MACCILFTFLWVFTMNVHAATITLDPQTRHQTINGWEAHVQTGAFTDDPAWY